MQQAFFAVIDVGSGGRGVKKTAGQARDGESHGRYNILALESAHEIAHELVLVT